MMPRFGRRRIHGLRNRLVVVIFCLCIAVPPLAGALGIPGAPWFTENRNPHPFPQLGEGPNMFLRGLDDYISDRFGFRPLLISAVNSAKLILGGHPNVGIAVGKQGWLYARRGVAGLLHGPFIQDYAQAFVDRARWSEAQGAHFVFFVVPRKETIYREYVPDWMKPVGPFTFIGSLRSSLRDNLVDVFYPDQALLDAKKEGKIFYRYDTHWTPIGAFIGARELINHLHRRYGMVPQFSEADYQFVSPGPECETKFDGSFFDLLVLEGVAPRNERCPDVMPKGSWKAKIESNSRNELVFTKDDPSLPTAVFYIDSFGTPLQKFIAEYFRRVVFVNPWPRYAVSLNGADQFPVAPVLEAKPDFVVYLRLETYLFVPTGNPPEVARFGEGRLVTDSPPRQDDSGRMAKHAP